MSMIRLRACWAARAPSGCGVTPRMCTRRVATSMTNSTYHRLRKTVSTMKKSPASSPSAGGAQESAPAGARTAWRGPVPPGPQHPPDGRLAHVAAGGGQLATGPAVSPGGVLPGQPQRPVADSCAGRWPAWPSRIGPVAGAETAVPGQHSSRCEEPAGPQRGGRQLVLPGPRGRPSLAWAGDLAPKHHALVTKDHDLRIFGCLAAAQQDQPAKTRIMIRYSRPTDTNRDLASARSFGQTAAHGPCIEFWSGTWTTVATGPVRRRMWAVKEGTTYTAWSAAALTMNIERAETGEYARRSLDRRQPCRLLSRNVAAGGLASGCLSRGGVPA